MLHLIGSHIVCRVIGNVHVCALIPGEGLGRIKENLL